LSMPVMQHRAFGRCSGPLVTVSVRGCAALPGRFPLTWPTVSVIASYVCSFGWGLRFEVASALDQAAGAMDRTGPHFPAGGSAWLSGLGGRIPVRSPLGAAYRCSAG